MIETHPDSRFPPAARLEAGAAIGTWRRYLGVALSAFASALAVVVAWQVLVAGPSSACGQDCMTTLRQSPYAIVLGIPALAWAAALHAVLFALVWALVLSPRRHHALLYSAQLGIVVILLAGSATYLVVGLSLDVRCAICLTMHGAALVAALGVAITPRVRSRHQLLQRVAAVALAAAAWVLLAWGLGRMKPPSVQAASSIAADKWMAAVCQPGACPAAARFGPEVLPDDASSIVLSEGSGPTLVAWLDLECAACRADFRAEEPVMRRLVRQGRGLRLLLRANAPACDALAAGGPASRCEAPAAIVCAARYGGADAALDLLARELSVEPGFFTLTDRRRALARLSPRAARCLDSELALGPRGTLAAHAESARRLERHARRHNPSCNPVGGGDAPWWCFSATPSFAVVATTPPAADRSSGRPFAAATGELRMEVLEQCLEVQ